MRERSEYSAACCALRLSAFCRTASRLLASLSTRDVRMTNSHVSSSSVALMSELSRIVDARALMEVSQVEQELACTEDHSSAVQEVESLLANRAVTPDDKLRLVLLYALRYEQSETSALHRFVDALGACGVPAERLRLIPALLEQCGARARSGDLFLNKSFFAVAKKQLQRGIKGVQNVYTQHQPYLAQTLEALAKNKLPVRAAWRRRACRAASSGAKLRTCRSRRARGPSRERIRDCRTRYAIAGPPRPPRRPPRPSPRSPPLPPAGARRRLHRAAARVPAPRQR